MATGELALEGVRLLVVENDSNICELLSWIFQWEGAEVFVVNLVCEAVEALKQIKPHALISNMQLPDGDSYSLLEQVRTATAELAETQLPMVALAASTLETDCSVALSSGFQGCLCKPIDPQDLISIIATLVQGKRQLREQDHWES